jgi:hypothetical protein
MLFPSPALLQAFGSPPPPPPPPPPDLSDPVQLAFVSAGAPSTIDTAAFLPPDDSLIIVAAHTRAGSNRTHTSITKVSGLTNLGTFTNPSLANGLGSAGGAAPFCRTTLWWAKNTGAGVSGVLRFTASGSTTVIAMGVYAVTGHDTGTPVPTASAAGDGNNTGTSITLTPGAAFDADAMAIMALTENSSVSNISPSSNFTELSENLLSTTKLYVQFRKGGVGSSPISLSGLLNNAVRAAALIETRRATS